VSGQKLAAGLAIVVVVAAIVVGLVISGSPERQRLLRLDSQRVSDLRNLSQWISVHYTSTRELPAELAEMVNGRMLSRVPLDPESGEAYAYEILDRREYELCAEFALPSEDPQLDGFWAHEAGRKCFPFDVASVGVQ
jgi:hypothetical protein